MYRLADWLAVILMHAAAQGIPEERLLYHNVWSRHLHLEPAHWVPPAQCCKDDKQNLGCSRDRAEGLATKATTRNVTHSCTIHGLSLKVFMSNCIAYHVARDAQIKERRGGE
eukprot:1247320-Amphidinium_carterae.1